MTHTPISTGDGWRCLHCKVAWDLCDEPPATCEIETDAFRFEGQPPDVLRIPDTPALRQYVEQVEPDMSPEALYTSRPGRTYTPSRVLAQRRRQIGGSHYAKLAIQPTEFCQRNGLDFCIGSILKYVTRHRDKNGRQDLEKALHFVDIRETYPQDIHPPRQIAIPMMAYVQRNNVPALEAEALYRLEAYYNATGKHRPICAGRLRTAINNLIREYDTPLT